ncbi:MAG: hypothetical protein Q9213_006399 [Squamulea squamosa]
MAPSAPGGVKRLDRSSRQTTIQQVEDGKALDLHHEQRRCLFLNKVRQKGEDKKFEVRGEQILRDDFFKTERHWIDSQNSSAPPPLTHTEDDDMTSTIPGNEQQSNEMIDQVLSQENEEVDALVSLLEENTSEASHQVEKRLDYGIDDENYDSIFLNILSSSSDERFSTPHAGHVPLGINDDGLTTEAMDTSGG